MISSSDERTAFRINGLLKQVEEGNMSSEEAKQAIEMYLSNEAQQRERETNPEWNKNNLEYDLRATDWIVTKARESEVYSQNLYAALCNNDFQKNEVWPKLKNQTWSCSWRYAGGIIADMRGKGDYMDWYCSGIRGGAALDDTELTDEQHDTIAWNDKYFVSESEVTNEIREDLFRLGWIVVDSGNEISI